jgi:hypothetical protein
MLPKQRFGRDAEIRTQRTFGDGFEIKYDTVTNHDAYSFLRVTLEVERGCDTEAVVLLNGLIVGKLVVFKHGARYGYKIWRRCQSSGTYTQHLSHVMFAEMGRAVAAIISDFVTEK